MPRDVFKKYGFLRCILSPHHWNVWSGGEARESVFLQAPRELQLGLGTTGLEVQSLVSTQTISSKPCPTLNGHWSWIRHLDFLIFELFHLSNMDEIIVPTSLGCCRTLRDSAH